MTVITKVPRSTAQFQDFIQIRVMFLTCNLELGFASPHSFCDVRLKIHRNSDSKWHRTANHLKFRYSEHLNKSHNSNLNARLEQKVNILGTSQRKSYKAHASDQQYTLHSGADERQDGLEDEHGSRSVCSWVQR